VTEEQIKTKIQLLKEEAALQIEGSVMHDHLCVEIEHLKAQLKILQEKLLAQQH
jgi:hypothetical protein